MCLWMCAGHSSHPMEQYGAFRRPDIKAATSTCPAWDSQVAGETFISWGHFSPMAEMCWGMVAAPTITSRLQALLYNSW